MELDLHDLEPVSRRSTASIVADRIRRAIMRGTFPPGTQLGEVELAARLGVSRGPLREAMQRLVAEGLLRSERHRGLFVRDLDAADVRDVYQARSAVERAAGLLILAGDRTAATQRLTAALADMEAAADSGDAVALADADHRFHHEFVAASGSPRLRRMADALLVETRMCLAALQQTAPPADSLIAEHATLRDAVRDGDADRLVAALEAHMSDAVTRILDVPAEAPVAGFPAAGTSAAAGAVAGSAVVDGAVVDGAVVNGALVDGAPAGGAVDGVLAGGASAAGVPADGASAAGVVLAGGPLAGGAMADGALVGGAMVGSAMADGALVGGAPADGAVVDGALERAVGRSSEPDPAGVA